MNFLQVWENILSPLVPVVTFLIGMFAESLRSYLLRHRKHAFDALALLYQPLCLFFMQKTPIHITSNDFPVSRQDFQFVTDKVGKYSYLMSVRSLEIYSRLVYLLKEEEYFMCKKASHIPPLHLGDVYLEFQDQIAREYFSLCDSLKTRSKLESIMKKHPADEDPQH